MAESSEPQLLDILRTVPYFEGAAAASLRTLAEQVRRFRAEPDETLFLEGEPAAGLWVIAQGSVKIYKINLEGDEHILHLLGAGNTFNEIASLDGGPNPANAAALSTVSGWLIPSQAIATLLTGDGALALRVIGLLARRVRALVGQIENLALYSVTIRLARFLLQQAGDPALSGPGVTRASIAAHLATTPESISRSLRSLEESGAIRFDRHRIMVVDEPLLRTIAAL
jgi:CRP/FNR family transcriptional regulator